jgi:hypothetical protein
MIYFKRFLWLAAWSVWLWFGFGLHRELPRGPGPKTCAMAGEGRTVLGFVGDSDTIAVSRRSNRSSGRELVLVDGRNGDELRQQPMPDLPPMVLMHNPTSATLGDPRTVVVKQSPGTLRYEILLGNGGPNKRSNPGLYALNVVNGERKQLTTLPVVQIVLHPSEPIVAIVGGEFGGVADRITVADYQSGEVLFEHPFPKRTSLYARPFFIPNRSLVAVPLLRRDATPKHSLEVWKFRNPTRLVKEWSGDDVPPMMPLSVSKTGRMLFQGRFESKSPDANWVEVYDFNDERYLSTISTAEQPMKKGGVYNHSADHAAMAIAPNGDAVLQLGRVV